VDGVDDDSASIEAALRHATDARAGNVRFVARDAAEPGIEGRYDLVCILEALHDMPQPVEVLRAARELLAPGGAVLVLDERVADTLAEGIGQPIERFMYAASVGHCLPVGMSSEPSEGTGAVMRVSTVQEYARRAGLEVTVLPIEHDCWRFYRLDPSTD
jgi:2-polyprenyl-3-methyl-5-hydroxy-6-metoxy-1,4-benzoquinol methylase